MSFVETDATPSSSDANKHLLSTIDDEDGPFVKHSGYKDPYVENASDILDVFEYPRNGSDPGLVVIFNQETFNSYQTRNGTRKDVEELITTLGRLKFNIEANYIFNDLGEKELKKTIKKICEEDHTKRNCLICVFLSHGEENNQLAVKDGLINAEDVYKEFTECSTLQGKPKLFIFQACKAKSLLDNSPDGIDKKDKKLVSENTLNITIPNDVVLSYSTLEDNVSFRNTECGSWFIQELCRNFTAYGRRDDVCSLIMRTSKCVANNYWYSKDTFDRKKNTTVIKNYKQMPIFITTLTKKFYLTKSRDRMELLRLKKENELLHLQLAELKQKFEELTNII